MTYPRLAIAALMLTWVAAGLFTVASVDSVRDIYQAFMIAGHGALPLTGPQLAFSIHQGPLWFYLLAIPAALFDTWGAIALFVFALASLKFILAYRLGSALHSAQLGLLLAVFLALPGWTHYQLIIWTSTSVLETTLLLYLLSLVHVYRTPSARGWLVTGLCFSLALHAHPTALPFGLLALLPLRGAAFNWRWPVLLGLGAISFYLPYLIYQLVQGFPDLAAAQQYQQSEFSPGGAESLLRLFSAIALYGPRLYYETTLPFPLAVGAMTLHAALVIVFVIAGCIGLRTSDTRLRSLLLLALATLLTVLLFVVFIRARTPNHFAYAPTFALMLCYACLATVAANAFARFYVARIIPVIVLALLLATTAGMVWKRYTHSIVFQEAVLFDVKTLKSDWKLSGLEIPAMHASTHAEFLCSLGPVVLHGPYAAMVDAHVGLEPWMRCDRRDHIFVGGVSDRPDVSHLVGISGSQLHPLAVAPERQVGNVAFFTPLAVSDHGTALPLAQGDMNPPRRLFRGGAGEIETAYLRSTGPSALLVSKPVGYFMSLDVRGAYCNGQAAKLAHRYNYSWLYLCDVAGGEGMEWSVDYSASADNLVDVVLLPASHP